MRPGWPDYTFAFHDREELGPKILSRIGSERGNENAQSRRPVYLYLLRRTDAHYASASRPRGIFADANGNTTHCDYHKA